MEKHIDILKERFGKDSLMSLATVDEKGKPWVRTMDAIFYDDSFYTITYGLSNKMKHIENNPVVAISGDWFSGYGIAENCGYIKNENNEEIANRLRTAFNVWYSNGHVNEEDSNTVILRIKLTDGVLSNNGEKIEF